MRYSMDASLVLLKFGRVTLPARHWSTRWSRRFGVGKFLIPLMAVSAFQVLVNRLLIDLLVLVAIEAGRGVLRQSQLREHKDAKAQGKPVKNRNQKWYSSVAVMMWDRYDG